MGYEVIYKFHDKLESGDYDREQTKDMRRKVGEPYEEVPLERLAPKIMAQLARRDILVVDVEINEYKKQKISFRETKGGIVIKNKRFVLDSDGDLKVVEEADVASAAHPHNAMPRGAQAPRSIMPSKEVAAQDTRKYVRLDEDAPVVARVKAAKLRLTPGKRYLVISQAPDPNDKRVDKFGGPVLDRRVLYTILDDGERETQVSADYFLPAEMSLIGGSFDNKSSGDEPRLSFDSEYIDDSEYTDNIPDIRARR